MVRHNNEVPHEHFHKEWDLRVRTWFNQAARKHRRAAKRAEKARRVFPRPTELLRPVVRCPSARYNMRVRAGRGFSVEELRAAKVNPKFARTVGIAVDLRRHNRSKESVELNAERLRTYMKNLALLPLNEKKMHEGEVAVEEFKKLTQVKGQVMPITQEKPKQEFVEKITDEQKKFSPVFTLHRARVEARNAGLKKASIVLRAKKAEERAKKAAKK